MTPLIPNYRLKDLKKWNTSKRRKRRRSGAMEVDNSSTDSEKSSDDDDASSNVVTIKDVEYFDPPISKKALLLFLKPF